MSLHAPEEQEPFPKGHGFLQLAEALNMDGPGLVPVILTVLHQDISLYVCRLKSGRYASMEGSRMGFIKKNL